ncbi:MAG: potassium channel family protein, partial [Thermoanaerobaculia bacterium]
MESFGGDAGRTPGDADRPAPFEAPQTTVSPPAPPSADEVRDLGFGSVVAGNRRRLLNRDGSFNVQRSGLSLGAALSPYHALLTMSWSRFLTLVALAYLALNAVFADAYLLCGPEAIGGAHDPGSSPFLRAFFFSVQTFATIGYGHIHPVGLSANVLVTVESLVGLL